MLAGRKALFLLKGGGGEETFEGRPQGGDSLRRFGGMGHPLMTARGGRGGLED